MQEVLGITLQPTHTLVLTKRLFYVHNGVSKRVEKTGGQHLQLRELYSTAVAYDHRDDNNYI